MYETNTYSVHVHVLGMQTHAHITLAEVIRARAGAYRATMQRGLGTDILLLACSVIYKQSLKLKTRTGEYKTLVYIHSTMVYHTYMYIH